MKIAQNTTEWPNWMLRRMISWCCQQLGMKVPKAPLAAKFRNSRSCWGGHARYWRGFTVCVGKAHRFPQANIYGVMMNDRVECLVEVTAHELAHLLQHQCHSRTRQRGGWGGSEPATDWHSRQVLDAFRLKRIALLAAWQEPPVLCKRGPELSIVDKRAAKARADLERWQRKLKLAQTKVRKLKTRVSYYQKKTSL